jgi:hypothetical protein
MQWYQESKPDLGDGRLKLIKQIWDYEGQLDLFAAWCWRNREATWSWSGGHTQSLDAVDPGPDWWRELERRFPEDRPKYRHGPFHGGTNALHLGHSAGSLSAQATGVELIRTSSSKRMAVLMVDHAKDWYGNLERLGKGLPDLGKRSWRVDVVVRPLGWLGTFRRSRCSGRWFQGRHLIHMWGN